MVTGGDPEHAALDVEIETRPENTTPGLFLPDLVQQMGRETRHGPRGTGKRLDEDRPEGDGVAPPRQPFEQGVAFLQQQGRVLSRPDERGRVGQHRQCRRLGPGEFVEGPVEETPCGGLDTDRVASEWRVPRVEPQDLLFRCRGLEPQREHTLDQFLAETPAAGPAAEPDELHRQCRSTADDMTRPDISESSTKESKRIDPRVEQKTAILVFEQRPAVLFR